jgi:hypothetical protein
MNHSNGLAEREARDGGHDQLIVSVFTGPVGGDPPMGYLIVV